MCDFMVYSTANFNYIQEPQNEITQCIMYIDEWQDIARNEISVASEFTHTKCTHLFVTIFDTSKVYFMNCIRRTSKGDKDPHFNANFERSHIFK